jgi:phospholipase C
VAHGGGQREQYVQTDIATYWRYAETYTLCDNYFTDVASQSEPNHLILIAASSPVIDNASWRRNRSGDLWESFDFQAPPRLSPP